MGSGPRDGKHGAVVFAPAPELTVTLERFGDREELHLHAGGQGFWLARMLGLLGVPTTLCGSFGGETGRVVRRLIEDAGGMDVVAVEVQAPNGAYVHDRRDGERREVGTQVAGPLSRHEIDDLHSSTLAAGLSCIVCVLGGPTLPDPPVPADLYERLALDLRANGAVVVADLSGDQRAAVLHAGLDVLKTSDEDLVTDGHLRPDASDGEVYDVMEALAGTGGGATRVIVTRGADRPPVALSDGELLSVTAPRVHAVDTAGAGDSVTAGVAAGLAGGRSFVDSLRLGVAAAALNVARHGLASGDPAAIETTAHSVRVEPAARQEVSG
jgi:1-phosphofructokinase